jgi:hypothetical protein
MPTRFATPAEATQFHVQFQPCRHITEVTMKDYFDRGGRRSQLDLIEDGRLAEPPQLPAEHCPDCRVLALIEQISAQDRKRISC